MTEKEAIQKIRDADNWTDDFFKEVEPVYMEHFNTIRNTLVKDGLWNRFDTAFCEWKKPGQVSLLNHGGAKKKSEKDSSAVCDKGKARAAKESPKLTVICLNDIEEKEIEWIWKPRIPKAKITLIQGAPGCSKTTFVCGVIADLTQGRPILGIEDGNENPFEPRKPSGR